MRFFLAFSFLLMFNSLFGQMKYNFNQYMLHQTVYNPGFVDVETKFSANSLYRRQWLKKENFPETFFVYGHYNFNRNHGVGAVISNDLLNKFNQFEIAANYVYNIPIGRRYNLGLGVKVGLIEQNLLNNKLTYFDPVEPTLEGGNYTSHWLNLGTGVSLTSKDLVVHVSLPQLFGNHFINDQKVYSVKNSHLFMNVGYKYHHSDWFVIYPNVMFYAVPGSKYHGAFNLNFLASQLIWFGGGVDTHLALNGSMGVFTQSGFRFVYSIDYRFLDITQSTGVSHELSLSYAKTIRDNPFSKRRTRGRGRGGFRR